MRFSKKEIKDLIYAWFMISLAFSILFSGGFTLFKNITSFIIIFMFSALTVGIAFVLHELMHKYYAQKYHAWAEFRAYNKGLLLALVLSFLGFIIAAPGSVYIRGRLTKNQNGKISLAGPATNIILAFIFLTGIFLTSNQLLNTFFNVGFMINSLLALFNLIPFSPFDGQKVYNWNKNIFYISIAIAGGLFLLSFVF
ncbi:MAG: site-2 protease family protein [Nanobdellota archaeon]